MFSFGRLPRLGRDKMEGRRQRKSSSSSSRGPRLDRRNAVKNFEYEAAGVGVSWASTSSEESSVGGAAAGGMRSRSLDLSPRRYANQTSFRIEGVEGEVDIICRNLGLSGPDDFAIPAAAWEARKARSSSDLLPRSRLVDSQNPPPPPAAAASASAPAAAEDDLVVGSSSETKVSGDVPKQDSRPPSNTGRGGGDGGVKIRGVRPPPVLSPRPPPVLSPRPPPVLSPRPPPVLSPRPPPVLSPRPPPVHSPRPQISKISPPPAQLPANPALAPPPAISRLDLDHDSSIWDIVRSFAPKDDEDGGDLVGNWQIDSEEEEETEEEEEEGGEEVWGGVEEEKEEEEEEELRVGETVANLTGSPSFSTSNDEDSSSTTTETTFVISPNGRFKRNITSWQRGARLGSGSFGTVYEGISNDGVFFAVKEVSLLDQGSNAQQCILQLEQEIALLSQFEHENIVQYYGSDKEEAKLYIFIELVTQGSLASLYQKYHLQDSQVCAYTRQILNGLSYLHDRNIVHRDIKCANILVDASGSVKLADFGLAKEITKLNMLKSCKGSAYWMAPEVVNPKGTYGPSADIWSLGCTVLEMLTRQVPYPHLEWAQAFFKIGQGEQPPIPTSLSRDASDFIRRCVQVKPDDRPSAAELLEHPFVKRPLPVSSGSDGSSHHSDRRRS